MSAAFIALYTSKNLVKEEKKQRREKINFMEYFSAPFINDVADRDYAFRVVGSRFYDEVDKLGFTFQDKEFHKKV